ncbi:PTS transporter subunit EIIC [Virgibacillus sp. 179-BFC.A HS]|uniref:PTS transporter subunit EIIC n=1 Tax=Tigheibacillus jepli TaxID=3035914 RepID=A0ABU5CHP3_9BACI|nr:PTS transporter subunit EIIC [Virgibacillus sp. 179-BFC.A HS]MDY0405053.1 PTS transporter subunit EIIC [Virgibacillus sp. 179-BFC.A HS]
MAEPKEQRLAREIYEHVGGMENVAKLINCMTRVRLTIRDYDKVDLDGLKAIDGVLGVVEEDSLQVIVGPGIVNKVANIMVEKAGVRLGEPFPDNPSGQTEQLTDRQRVEAKAAERKAQEKAKHNHNSPFKKVLKSIANIFVPLIPAFVGAGIVGGIAAIFANLLTAGSISQDWEPIITTLNIIKNGLFAYLVVYVGINSANEFGATPGLGGIIGAITMLPGMDPESPLSNIFNGHDLAAGQGGIIGVIFAVWILALVEKRLHKIIPNAVDIIITPTIALLLVGLFTIFIVMPIAGVVSSALVGSITWVLNVGGVFAGFILGLFFLPLVMFGLHQVLTPIHIEMINASGFTLLLPILAMAGAGQVGAAFALWVRCRKNQKLTQLIKGALPVGMLGIGEPLIYGVTLPLGRPFITACIGGGIGGAVIAGIGNIGAIAIGPSGIPLIPLIANGHWMGYVIGLISGYIGGFIVTYLFGVPKEIRQETKID